MARNEILVVDDEVGIRELLSEILTDEGYEVSVAENGGAARNFRRHSRPALVLLDIWMPDIDGITLLKEWASSGMLTMPVVMMSGHGTIETAVEATRIGAFDFLEKPITLPKLLAMVERALERGQTQFKPGLTLANLGKSPAVVELKKRLDQVANRKMPLLLVGEKGCGVELCARYVHQPNTPWLGPDDNGWLAENPFQVLPETRDGILFVADVVNLNRQEQRGLIHLLGKLDKHNVRLVCGASKPLPVLVSQDRFDVDLANRLGMLTIVVPPLREHPEDIVDIANLLLAQMIEAREVPMKRLATGALNVLRNLDWPGNIPSLANAVRTLALITSETEITAEDVERVALQFSPRETPADALAQALPLDLPLREARDVFEKVYFEHHIRLETGNMSRVAEKVGLERTHLYRKLKQLGIRPAHPGRNESEQ
jgi:two-component system, NtrC family, nitrogen regulation response regulator NtrX